jgi:hypothetical protein
MDSVIGKPSRKRRRFADRLLLLLAGVLVAGGGAVAFWIADAHHVTVGLFALVIALSFLPVARPYRSKFGSRDFILFFVAWLLVHTLLSLLVLGYFGLLYYLPFVVLELWGGYMVAFWLFGPPPDKGIRSDDPER